MDHQCFPTEVSIVMILFLYRHFILGIMGKKVESRNVNLFVIYRLPDFKESGPNM